MATNLTPQNIACLETLALNILKISSLEKIASNINIPELDPCWLYNQELFLYKIKKPITLLICGHLYHHNCIESSIKINSTCPRPDCNKEIESTVVSMLGSQDINLMEMSPTIFKSPMFTQSDISKKHTNDPKLFLDKPSNKKVKKPVKKESDILEDLIKELSTEPETQVPVIRKENAISFNDLYNNITNSEMQNEIMNQDVITNYYLFGKALSERLEHHKKSNPPYASLLLVNKEVRKQIPNIMDTTLWKKVERSRKLYTLFINIGEDKIQRPGLSVRLNHPKVIISGNSIVDSIVGAFNARIDSTKRSQEHQKESDQTKRNQKRSKVTIADDNVDEIETLDNHNNRVETIDGIEIVDDHEDVLEDDESLEFDFDSVVKSLQQEPINEWKVHGINVTRKFREYQQEALETLKTTGLTWYNTYEIFVLTYKYHFTLHFRALSSIIVLGRNCPYPNFTEEEWQSITQTNKYTIHEPVMPSSVSTALHETVIKHLSGRDSYMHADETPLSRTVARTFNELRENLPDLAPQRTSEDEHCRIFLNPYISPIFLKKNNNYEVQLNRAVKGTKQRPDLSCVVDNVPLLNSEIKPMGSRPLNKKKDFSKVHLRARKTINQQLTSKGGPGETAMLLNHGDIVQTYFMDLQFDGLYRSWPFLTTKLAIDEPSLPLIESNLAHFVALEVFISLGGINIIGLGDIVGLG
ncbi:17919_t:CDS:2, partial [Gigaspora margarita]